MATQPKTTAAERRHERDCAKARVVQAFHASRDWRSTASANDISYHTGRRAILRDGETAPRRGGSRQANVKMSVEAMCALEAYIDEYCRQSLNSLRDRLLSDLGVAVSKSTVHRALKKMLYTVKRVRIERAAMNTSENKAKRSAFVQTINTHVSNGDLIIYHDETNFNLYLSRSTGWSRAGERATVVLPSSQGNNLHVVGEVTSSSGLLLLKTSDGSIKKEQNARFIADLFVAAMRSDEYASLSPNNKVVIVTDNAPAHSEVERLARECLAEDGIANAGKLVIVRLGPYSPMLNPIEGCWSVLKSIMRTFMREKRDEFMVRGAYNTFKDHRMALLVEAVEVSSPCITQRLVLREERHCMRLWCAAERMEDMQLGV